MPSIQRQSVARWRLRLPGKARLPVIILAAGILALANSTPAPAVDARTRVDLELVLAVDTSGSVDMHEYTLQMQGLIAAFRDPAIIAAIHATGPNGIAVTLVHWSSASEQEQVVAWTQIHDATTADAFAASIEELPRRRRFFDSTGIGSVLQFGERLIRRNRFDGRRKSIDVSGDGVNNSGIPPELIRDDVVAGGVTINGLAILDEAPHLQAYFARNVIGGAGAFVMTVEGYIDIIAGTRAKLLREISVSIAGRDEADGSHYQ